MMATFGLTSTGSGVGCTSPVARSSGEGSSAVYNEVADAIHNDHGKCWTTKINAAKRVDLDENFIKSEVAAATPEETISGSLSQSFLGGRPHTIKVLKKRVKRLERKKKSKTLRFKRLRRVGAALKVESSTDIVLGAEEDASKQGKIADIDADEGITLVDIETDE
uniref:Uncharacterized protein n=1 Tax=Tanacetum cinerariifolium TaxID=118510 RepID=A0A6L2KQ06_TANCI|nr:hypothetical protein [Tanacetum cinerariifolium]